MTLEVMLILMTIFIAREALHLRNWLWKSDAETMCIKKIQQDIENTSEVGERFEYVKTEIKTKLEKANETKWTSQNTETTSSPKQPNRNFDGILSNNSKCKIERMELKNSKPAQVEEGLVQMKKIWSIDTDQAFYRSGFYKLTLKKWYRFRKDFLLYRVESILATAASFKALHEKLCLHGSLPSSVQANFPVEAATPWKSARAFMQSKATKSARAKRHLKQLSKYFEELMAASESLNLSQAFEYKLFMTTHRLEDVRINGSKS